MSNLINNLLEFSESGELLIMEHPSELITEAYKYICILKKFAASHYEDAQGEIEDINNILQAFIKCGQKFDKEAWEAHIKAPGDICLPDKLCVDRFKEVDQMVEKVEIKRDISRLLKWLKESREAIDDNA